MNEAYLSLETLRTFAYQVDEDGLKFLEDLLPRASRIFDKLCDVSPNWFQPAADGPATAKTLYGNGSQLLALPPYFGDEPTITLPDGYTAPHFVVKGGYLMTTDSNGVLQTGPKVVYPAIWPSGVPIQITAKWGFEKTPDDVVEAVAELSIAIWRSKDTAFLKAINLESISVIAEAVPKRVMMIASSYRANFLYPAFV
jgi:hypothetical protein